MECEFLSSETVSILGWHLNAKIGSREYEWQLDGYPVIVSDLEAAGTSFDVALAGRFFDSNTLAILAPLFASCRAVGGWREIFHGYGVGDDPGVSSVVALAAPAEGQMAALRADWMVVSLSQDSAGWSPWVAGEPRSVAPIRDSRG